MQKLMESIITLRKITEICNKNIFQPFSKWFNVQNEFGDLCNI